MVLRKGGAYGYDFVNVGIIRHPLDPDNTFFKGQQRQAFPTITIKILEYIQKVFH